MSPLELGTSTGGGGLGEKIADGIWGKEGTIVEARQQFDKELGSYSPDIFLTLEIDSNSQYNDEIDIFGSFQRDERTNEITGWGGAFKVDQVLNELGAYDGLSDAEKQLEGVQLPQQALDAVRGMRVWYVVYCSGKHPNKDKPVYNTYWRVLPASEDANKERSYESICESLVGDNYHREKLEAGRQYLAERDSGDASFNYGANRGNSPSPQGGGSGGSLDDDLPI